MIRSLSSQNPGHNYLHSVTHQGSTATLPAGASPADDPAVVSSQRTGNKNFERGNSEAGVKVEGAAGTEASDTRTGANEPEGAAVTSGTLSAEQLTHQCLRLCLVCCHIIGNDPLMDAASVRVLSLVLFGSEPQCAAKIKSLLAANHKPLVSAMHRLLGGGASLAPPAGATVQAAAAAGTPSPALAGAAAARAAKLLEIILSLGEHAASAQPASIFSYSASSGLCLQLTALLASPQLAADEALTAVVAQRLARHDALHRQISSAARQLSITGLKSNGDFVCLLSILTAAAVQRLGSRAVPSETADANLAYASDYAATSTALLAASRQAAGTASSSGGGGDGGLDHHRPTTSSQQGVAPRSANDQAKLCKPLRIDVAKIVKLGHIGFLLRLLDTLEDHDRGVELFALLCMQLVQVRGASYIPFFWVEDAAMSGEDTITLQHHDII